MYIYIRAVIWIILIFSTLFSIRNDASEATKLARETKVFNDVFCYIMEFLVPSQEWISIGYLRLEQLLLVLSYCTQLSQLVEHSYWGWFSCIDQSKQNSRVFYKCFSECIRTLLLLSCWRGMNISGTKTSDMLIDREDEEHWKCWQTSLIALRLNSLCTKSCQDSAMLRETNSSYFIGINIG